MFKEFEYHIPMPDECRTIEKLYSCLCDVAVERKRRNDIAAVFPEACENCVVQCNYGKKLVELWQKDETLPKTKKTALA